LENQGLKSPPVGDLGDAPIFTITSIIIKSKNKTCQKKAAGLSKFNSKLPNSLSKNCPTAYLKTDFFKIK
jgi:hypothetical protein